MLIRCEKCSTLYELDDKLLPAQGAPVQCSKCQFVFKAYPVPPPEPAPNRAANDTPEEIQRAEETNERPAPHRDEVVREGGALAHSFDRLASRPMDAPPPPSLETGAGGTPPMGPSSRQSGSKGAGQAGAEGPKFTADGRPIRKVPFPSGDPPQAGPRPPPMRGPVPKTVRTGGALRWVIVVVVVVAMLVAAAVAWNALRPRTGTRTSGAPAGQSRVAPQGGTPAAPARN